MKTERRHELRENDLAHALQTATSYVGQNAKQLGMLAFAGVAVVTVVTIALGSRSIGREEAWLEMGNLSFATVEEGRRSVETLREIIQEADDDEFIMTGLMTLGGQALRIAQDVDVPPDVEFNDAARQAFEQLLQRFERQPLAFAAAHSGLATVAENDFVLDPGPSHKERAERHLSAIVQNKALAGLPFFKMATNRMEQLDDTFTIVRFDPATIVDTIKVLGIADAPSAPGEKEGEPEKLRLLIHPDGTQEWLDPNAPLESLKKKTP